MGKLSSKLRSTPDGLIFWCPGCDGAHVIKTVGSHAWTYNGDPEFPTFSPSVLVSYNGTDAGIDGAPPAICHFFVNNGQMQFLTDCTHDLAGTTITMPDFDV